VLAAREVSSVIDPTFPMLLDSVKDLYDQKSVDLVTRAYDFARDAHGDERRLSGEPYISHPIATAYYLASMRLDAATVSAGLLHDVVEDTDSTITDISSEFGSTIARLVDGVTKFAEIRRRAGDPREPDADSKRRTDYTREQAENLRKMFLAMAEDPRVVIVKLADRLHNMRTLDVLRPEKQRRIALDTREIYAPLAGRLGIAQLKWPLEDLAFKYLEPDQYRWLIQQLAEQLENRQAFVDAMVEELGDMLQTHGIEAEITGRPKHLYSIYRKLLRPEINMDISRVFDLFALRVLVDSEGTCYQVLGLVHSIWPPLGSSRIKDYIALPKPNGYQSLHTTVAPANGRTIEVQIRSRHMHEIAEFGLAAHWYYKEQGQSVALPETLTEWVKSLTSWQQELGQDAADFVDTLKVDMFGGEVFVFSPKGDVIDLPAGSTPVDFAYRIHTDVGNRCMGAKVNGIMVPLSHELKTGDRVEILTTKVARGPGRDWMTFVKTASAKQKIRQWFKKQNREENVARGRDLLDHELQRLDQRTLGEVNLDVLAHVAEQMHYRSLDDLLAAIGYGAQSAHGVVARLGLRAQPDSPPIPAEAPAVGEAGPGVQVMGVGNLLTRMATCCAPALGDPIIGYITRNRGVTVHRQDCPRIRSETEKERLVPVEWGQQVSQELFSVPIVIEAWDRDGLLRDIAAAMSDERIGLSAANATTHNDGTATIRVTVRIAGIDQLSRAFTLLERIPGVRDVHRDGSVKGTSTGSGGSRQQAASA
jgi:GTP diphosphokinase / guanosine-3',5'-bis(diphosphate) 3'-diphosphatase